MYNDSWHALNMLVVVPRRARGLWSSRHKCFRARARGRRSALQHDKRRPTHCTSEIGWLRDEEGNLIATSHSYRTARVSAARRPRQTTQDRHLRHSLGRLAVSHRRPVGGDGGVLVPGGGDEGVAVAVCAGVNGGVTVAPWAGLGESAMGRWRWTGGSGATRRSRRRGYGRGGRCGWGRRQGRCVWREEG
eukprot:4514296-Prymnesium_polylepis.1